MQFIFIFLIYPIYGLNHNKNFQALYKKVCTSPFTGVPHDHEPYYGPKDQIYAMYKKIFTNCTYIKGNLVISFLDQYDDYDMSFLSQIQEVTGYVMIFGNHFSYPGLTSLKVIRGDDQFYERTMFNEGNGIGYSLYIAKNYKSNSAAVGLKELRMVSLREIVNGYVRLYENSLLCHDNTILWKDIIGSDGNEFNAQTIDPHLRSCNSCDESCEFGGHLNCWGDGPHMCQKLTKISCARQCDERCFGVHPNECCHPECVGGCSGPTKADCFTCRNVMDDNQCVNSCPPVTIYKNYEWVSNPNVKYKYENTCVKQCPEHTMTQIRELGYCVIDCGSSHVAIDGKCVPCNGPCPKNCTGTGSHFIHGGNIDNFTDCTIINGNIKITDNSFISNVGRGIIPLTIADLQMLSNVQEITEYLHIHTNNSELTNLSFLSNLRIIHGRTLDMYSKSFTIHQTSLTHLGLKSLNQITTGNILISDNYNLCYYESINWAKRIHRREFKPAIYISNNKKENECAQAGRTCSDMCSNEGCWGPGDDLCISCAYYKMDQRCVKSCSSSVGWYSIEGSNECKSCHPECKGSCNGVGSNNCVECLHVRDGPYCLNTCPSFKYADENNICKPCHPACEQSTGCTGPLGIQGTGGCNYCAVVVFKEITKNNAIYNSYCLMADEPCPLGFYSQYIKHNSSNFGAQQVCHKCHHECTSCIGPQLELCLIDSCIHFMESSKCVRNCSDDYYPDYNTHQCHRCDQLCLGCYGPRASDCILCRYFKLYADYSNRNVDPGDFNCTQKCPQSQPMSSIENINNRSEHVCVTEAFLDEFVTPNKQHTLMIVIVCISGVVIISIIILIIVYLRRQLSKTEESKLRLTARISGLCECEPLTPSEVKPDMAVLRLIKESELKRGNIIGSGAFGTVYKGAWIPEGENVKIPVAIKVLQEGTNNSQNKEILQEARIMASVEHACCIRILALCMTQQVMLVTQLMPLGCLLDYIRKNRCNTGSKALLNWSYQIAKGMKYLEDRGIVHRDLAARNVLVHSPNHVKITDFGLSKLLDLDEEQMQVTGGKMPIRWLALECIQYRTFNHKSDVWSFGVTMWELYTYGQRPYENVRAKDIAYLLEKGERLSQPAICTIDVYMIMIKCWMLDAHSRPSFRELAEEFSKMARDPGRFLVIPGDKLMRLPTQIYQAKDLLAGDSGTETIISADEYLQPGAANCLYNNGTNSNDKHHRSNDYKNSDSRQRSRNCYRYNNSHSSNSSSRKNCDDIEWSMSRYCRDPCKDTSDSKDDDPVTSVDSSGFKDDDEEANEIEDQLLPLVDENDYLKPKYLSPPSYLDLIDDDDDSNETMQSDMVKKEDLLPTQLLPNVKSITPSKFNIPILTPQPTILQPQQIKLPTLQSGISNPEYFDDCVDPRVSTEVRITPEPRKEWPGPTPRKLRTAESNLLIELKGLQVGLPAETHV